MKHIAIVTSIKPSPINAGGLPSGLIWEIIEVLKENDIKYDIYIYPENKNTRIKRMLNRYGFYLEQCKLNFDNYDKIIVYRGNIGLFIPFKYRKKIIAIGPDSASITEARLYKETKCIIRKIIKGVYYQLARFYEYRILKDVESYLVVGNTDKRWMKRNFLIKGNDKLEEKIKFIRHPILKNVIFKELNFDLTSVKKKRFVFSGDFDERFNRNFLMDIFNFLNENIKLDNKMSFIIIGKNNKWIFNELKKMKNFEVEYTEWIDDYKDVCMIGKDVHCLPMLVGAGTKNRTLIALGNGLEIITTPIGIENIPYKNLTSIYITRKAKTFAKYMMMLNNKYLNEEELNDLVIERLNFRRLVENKYIEDVNRTIINQI
ncbi:hypothetical protein [Megamonas funiformis]|uniref:hypothetical protein n=1 Tax=Megamonas funiformis TaxID=437897 RepID=UPI00402767EA